MTPKQLSILNAWRQAGQRFAGYFITPENDLFISIMERPPQADKPAPPVMRFKYNQNGEIVNSGLYPSILSANQI